MHLVTREAFLIKIIHVSRAGRVFTGAIFHGVQSRCSLIHLVSAVTLGLSGMNSHLTPENSRAIQWLVGFGILLKCSPAFPVFCQSSTHSLTFLWCKRGSSNISLDPCYCDSCDGCCLLSLQDMITTAVYLAALSGCVDGVNSLFLAHLSDSFSTFPFQKLLNQV